MNGVEQEFDVRGSALALANSSEAGGRLPSPILVCFLASPFLPGLVHLAQLWIGRAALAKPFAFKRA